MKPAQNEQLRHAALDVLAPRFPTALPLGGVRRRIAADALVDFGYSDDELEACLMFLREEKFTDFTSDALGSSKWWRATSEVVKRFERG
jgi:hypothetical protein